MRFSTILSVAAAVGVATAQANCNYNALATCIEAVTVAPQAAATCGSNNGCLCNIYQSVYSVEVACYSSYCPAVAIPTSAYQDYSSICNNNGALNTGTIGVIPTATGAVASATSAAAGTTATSKANADKVLAPAGGIIVAMLGLLAYL